MPQGPGGVFFAQVTQPNYTEPAKKRAVVFIDGQNLYHSVRECFGASHPNYDVLKLANMACNQLGAMFTEGRFYTGFPDAKDDPQWNRFWTKKLLAISRQGIKQFSRALRYRDHVISIGHGTTLTKRIGEEKGIDVRIAIDLIRLAHRQRYDVAVVFSQDQDLSEVADEIRVISVEQKRWIQMVSAYPYKSGASNVRGINKTQWLKIDEASYHACIDPYDYR